MKPHSSSADARTKYLKRGILVAVLMVIVLGYTQFSDALSLQNLVSGEEQLREHQRANPVLVYGLAFLIYSTVTGLSLPGAAAMTLLFGWYFGMLPALIVVSFASTTGATLAFLLSRYLLRESIQARFGTRLAAFNEALDKEGAFYLFTLRLIPAVPFFVINVVMGLTPVRTITYWWVSQVGMLPGTIVYVYAGTSVPDLKTLIDMEPADVLSGRLITAFVLLGVFPIVVKKLIDRYRGSNR